MLTDIFCILLLLLVAALFWRERQHSELAALALRRYCKSQGLQLLSVALAHRRWQRGALTRSYQFEFSSDGEQRYQGVLRLRGLKVEAIDLPPFRMQDADEVSGQTYSAESAQRIAAPVTLGPLFDMLGLPTDELAIHRFIRSHSLDDAQALADAPFWSPQQAAFLRSQRHSSRWHTSLGELERLLRH